MNYQLLLLLSLTFNSSYTSIETCRQIQIISYTTKRGKIDPFGLTPLVKDYFQKRGFELGTPLATTDKPDCQLYQCPISHTEDYWKFKRDSVCLTITEQG